MRRIHRAYGPGVVFALTMLSWLSPGDLESRAFALPPNCTELGQPLLDHSCFHAQFGPYQTVNATATPPGPNINTTHTQYTVNLISGGGNVTYRPARTGDWALFTSSDIALTVVDPGGQPMPVQLTDVTTTCAQLPRARVYALAANVTYRIVFGPSSSSSVNVVLELLADFEVFYNPDADGDGYGSANDELLTSCQPPSGYVNNDNDCDDTRATVRPGAVEVANGRDDDCDGQVDEGVAAVPLEPGWTLPAALLALGWLSVARRRGAGHAASTRELQ